jgi:hypothetical protein
MLNLGLAMMKFQSISKCFSASRGGLVLPAGMKVRPTRPVTHFSLNIRNATPSAGAKPTGLERKTGHGPTSRMASQPFGGA